MATKREVEIERRRRHAYWEGALYALQFTCRRMLQPGMWTWLDRLEIWALSAGDSSLPQEMPRPESGHWPPTLGFDWVDAACDPDVPGRYLVTIACAAEEGVPAAERVDLVAWGEYAFAAPKGLREADLLPGQRFCPVERAVHGFGWHAYDRTTDACTVWHPSRADERIKAWCGAPPPAPANMRTGAKATGATGAAGVKP